MLENTGGGCDEGLLPPHHAGEHVYGEGEDDGGVLLSRDRVQCL